MIKGKFEGYLNLYTFQRKAILNTPTFSIFDIKTPYNMSLINLKKLSVGEDNQDIGVIVGNKKMIDLKNINIGFKGKLAMSFKHPKNIIFRMIKPSEKEWEYSKWLKIMEPYIHIIKPSYVMFPINKKYNINSIDGCNLIVNELNAALFLYSLDSDLILYQKNEPISSLAYIISNMGYSDKLSLCLNLDFLLKEYDSLSDIVDEIYKFNIQNRISVIYTSKYSDSNPNFKRFIERINDEIIIYGEKI